MIVAAALAAAAPAAAQVEILNVSYDPTREFYSELNEAFAARWNAQTGAAVTIRQSHGGSGAQARAVIDGLEAEVLTLAISVDVDRVAEATSRLRADWRDRLPNR
jgi:sulfate/thiosulfate transport system substrate-binding protein